MSKPAPGPPAEPAAFDEALYLRLNPDVQQAVADGIFASGRAHYEHYGRAEGRPTALPRRARDRVVVSVDPARLAAEAHLPAGNVDEVRLSAGGGIFCAGWVDDVDDPLASIDLFFPAWSISFSGAKLARVRRADAEAALGLEGPHLLGFWGFFHAGRALPAAVCNAVIRLKSGAERAATLAVAADEDEALRTRALTMLAQAGHTGSAYYAAVQGIDAQIGAQLLAFNKGLVTAAVQAPYVERFGPVAEKYDGSIVVCLFGRTEFLFLQQAIFARQQGIGRYEFIYVCNSPDLAEPLLNEARLAALIYGLSVSIILLAGNAGFAAANNLAARHARSARLLFVNPDVFPYEADWAAKHSAIVAERPAAQTDIFGAPLYYDDGSLMHGGMFFERDRMPKFTRGRHVITEILRVEHYGKGAPPDTEVFLRARPVPAVTGAFISTARDWFERLGGFTEDYIFGHYEDADLCLKSLQAGRAAWIQDVPAWHLEGKGGTRAPEHEGGAIVNRWLFTKSWRDFVADGLLGAAPDRAPFGGAES